MQYRILRSALCNMHLESDQWRPQLQIKWWKMQLMLVSGDPHIATSGCSITYIRLRILSSLVNLQLLMSLALCLTTQRGINLRQCY